MTMFEENSWVSLCESYDRMAETATRHLSATRHSAWNWVTWLTSVIGVCSNVSSMLQRPRLWQTVVQSSNASVCRYLQSFIHFFDTVYSNVIRQYLQRRNQTSCDDMRNIFRFWSWYCARCTSRKYWPNVRVAFARYSRCPRTNSYALWKSVNLKK